MRKKLIPIIILIFLGFLLFCLFYKIVYHLKSVEFAIVLNFQYKSLKDVDESWGANFEREFLKISAIKEILVFSYPNKCEIHLKISPFILNKSSIIEKVTLKTYSLVNNLNCNNEKIEIDFDFDCNKKFDYFLVISFLNDDFENFFDFHNKYLTSILNSKLIKRWKMFPKNPFASYLYFDYDVLRKFGLDLESIKKIIDNNNITFNFYYLKNPESSFLSNVSADIDNLYDIKNIVIPFKDKNFGIKLQEIIEVKNGFLNINDSKIIYKNKNSIIFAFNKPFFIPDVIYFPYFKNKLNKTLNKNCADYAKSFRIDFMKTNLFKKTLVNSSDKIILNDFDSIYFIKQKSPKISLNDEIEEFDSNNIAILGKKTHKVQKNIHKKSENEILILKANFYETELKIDEILKKYAKKGTDVKILLTKREKMIFKKINNYFLSDYQIEKNELLNSLIASSEGLFLDYYQNGVYKIPIILKNKNKNSSSFIYSKNSNVLYDVNSFLSTEVKNRYSQITRKNGKILTLVKILK